jgi:predicted nuclease with TOPRIM domain
MTTSNISALIDRYADIKGRMASLEAEETALKAALAEVPAGNYENERYRLSLIDRTDSKPDDELKAEIAKVTKAAVEAYRATLSSQYLCAHTLKTPVRTHRLGTPTGKDLAL